MIPGLTSHSSRNNAPLQDCYRIGMLAMCKALSLNGNLERSSQILL
jgi:hypothetical protein